MTLTPHSSGGVLSGATAVASEAGIATFSNLAINKSGTGYTLVARAPGLPDATSEPISVVAANPVALSFTVQPTNIVAGDPAPLQVTIVDAFGNAATTTASDVTVTLVANSFGATVLGTATATAVGGIATLSLSVDKVGTGYAFAAAANGLTPATSTTFAVTAGAASRLRFATQPTDAPATIDITPSATVQVVDNFDNLISTAVNAIAIQLAANAGGAVLIGGPAQQNAVNGVATFAGIASDRSGAGLALQATSAGLTSATSSAFNVTPGPAKLGIITQPSATVAGVAISPGLAVSVMDASDNVITRATHTVTIALSANPNGGVVSGTLTAAASNGVARFANVRLNRIGGGYTLVASSGNLTSATTNAFIITPAPASRLRFETQPSGANQGVAMGAFSIAVTDSLGNVVADYSGAPVGLALSDPDRGLTGTLSVAPVSGVATFNDVSVAQPGNGLTISAQVTGLASATSSAFAILPTPAFTISLAEASGIVQRGQSRSVGVTINRTNFNGDVQLSAENLPTGVTASFVPAILGSGITTSTLTLSANTSATAGPGTITVRATSANMPERVGTYDADVYLAGSYSLSTTPGFLTVNRGSTNSARVLLERTNLPETINLSVAPPSGVTAAFTSAVVAGNTATLEFSASVMAPSGTFAVTVTGAAPGSANRTATIIVKVQDVPTTTPFTLNFCSGEYVKWFAYQNDGFPWVRIVPDGSGQVTFAATPSVALAIIRDIGGAGGNPYVTKLIYATTAELQAMNGAPCAKPFPFGTKELSGSFAGLTSGEDVIFGLGPYDWRTSTGFTFNYLPDDPLDLVAVKTMACCIWPLSVIVRRDIAQASGTLPVLDFASGESTSLVTRTTTAGPSENTELQAWFTTKRGTRVTLERGLIPAGYTASFATRWVPASLHGPGDFTTLTMESRVSLDLLRGVTVFTNIPADRTLIPNPAQLSTPTVTVVPFSSYPRLRARLASQPQYGAVMRVFLEHSSPRREVDLTMTAAYHGSTPQTWDVEIPDFSGMSGFDSAWGIQPSASVVSGFTGYGMSRPSLLFGAAPNNEDTYQYAFRKIGPMTAASAFSASFLGRN